MVKGPGTVIFTCFCGMLLQEQQVLHFDRMLAADLADDARHRVRVAGAVERAAGIVDVDALERGGEAVGVALAPDLAVGDDVQARPPPARGWRARVASSCASARNGSGMRHSSLRAHARREAPGELLAVDQPLGLRVAADQRGGKQHRFLSVDEFRGNLPQPGRIDAPAALNIAPGELARREFHVLGEALVPGAARVGRRHQLVDDRPARRLERRQGLAARRCMLSDSALSSAMASSMASRVPEPMEKCAVRRASPISTTLPARQRCVSYVGEIAPDRLVRDETVPSQGLGEDLLAVGQRLPPRPCAAKPARSQVAASHSTTKVLISRRVPVVVRVEVAVLVLDEGLRQGVEHASWCRTRRTCWPSGVIVVPKSRRAAHGRVGAVGRDDQVVAFRGRPVNASLSIFRHDARRSPRCCCSSRSNFSRPMAAKPMPSITTGVPRWTTVRSVHCSICGVISVVGRRDRRRAGTRARGRRTPRRSRRSSRRGSARRRGSRQSGCRRLAR